MARIVPRMWIVVVAMVVVAMLIACGAGPLGSSGISGHTVVDAGCPVLQETESTCPDQPLSARLTVTGPNGQAIAETISNEHGEYRINLPPGDYTITPSNLNGAPLPYATPMQATVHEGAFTELEVKFDSGVR